MPKDIRRVAAALLLWGFGYGLYGYIFPLYITSLGAGPQQVGLVFSAMMVALAASYIPGGYLADRFERKRTIALTWLVGAPAPLLFFAARDYRMVAVGAVLYSVSMVGYPSLNAYVDACATQGRAGRAFGYINAAYGAGMVLSPLLGGWLAEHWGARSIFLISFGLYAAATGVIGMLTPQKPPIPEKRWNTAAYLTLLKYRPFLRYVALFAVVALSYYVVQPFIPQYLRDHSGMSIVFVGLTGSLMSLGQSTLTLLYGRMADRSSVARALGLASSVFALALLGLVYLVHPVGLGMAAILAGSFMAGQGVALAGVGVAAGGVASGRAFALFSLVVAASSVAGPYLGGVLYAHSAEQPFYFSIILAIVAGLAFFLRGLRRPGVSTQHEEVSRISTGR